ncbi:MAG TPA: hypothetical protein VJA21_29045, partial [Verrucomicrobiae bacterium]
PERGRLREALAAVHDLERLVARASLGTAGPRDLVALREVDRDVIGRFSVNGRMLQSRRGSARPNPAPNPGSPENKRKSIERQICVLLCLVTLIVYLTSARWQPLNENYSRNLRM